MYSAVKTKNHNLKAKIVIVGAGPAGASLAIRLAKNDFSVALIEREKFPRHKLCGEFMSPECLAHFAELGVLDAMLAAGGDRISETVFYAPDGKNVTVPSKWFNNEQNALSLSRAEMDERLLEKARESGVEIFEETQATGILTESGRICGVKLKRQGGETQELAADILIDATGRASVLGKLAEKIEIQNSRFKIQNSERKSQQLKSGKQKRLVGFKTHLSGAAIEKSRCEIYFFRGGYGGLSRVENNLANHCFLIEAAIVKEFSGDADAIVEKLIFKNKRAAETLGIAAPVNDWLAVSVDGFGVRNLNPAKNLFAVGDSAAFIDPFTGSGMLMALESAKILSAAIAENSFAPELIAARYRNLHREKFQNRLRLCALMRRAAFSPTFSSFLIRALSANESARAFLARATRRSL